ncbi:MAG: nitroreductase/quinone reductase family protein [bacterium]|nr:nitroreductase/quinone reductase family protein [bacterium]
MSLSNTFFSLLNVGMRPLLRMGVAKGNLCILRYAGRKSGKQYETPLSYVREGSQVRLLSSYNTSWWKNFTGESRPVEVEIAGERLPGSARAITTDSEAFRTGVREFLTALPRDASVYGIKLEADRTPRASDIEQCASHVVLIEVELDGA